MKQSVENSTVLDILNNVIIKFKIEEHYEKQNTSDAHERWLNIEELSNGIADYCEEKESNGLQEFLEEVSLLTDIDKWNDDTKQVTLMTLHSSKG